MNPAAVQLLYFAWLRERLGRGEEQVSLPPGVATIGALTQWLHQRGPDWQAALGPTVRCAVNQVFATETTAIAAGDEIAYFPPVTGG